jgi:hypothetical protein
MKKHAYQTIAGRTLEFGQRKFAREPEWSEFAAW